jgi:hypothetical protein
MPIENIAPERPLLIGIAGRAGAGKDTAANYLEACYGCERIGFADPLVDMLYALFAAADVPTCHMTERALKEQPTPLGPSYRRLMQTLGTEWGRNTINRGFWVQVAGRRLATRRLHGQSVVFSDVRFMNELEFIKREGGTVIRVLREQAGNVEAHVSETELDGAAVDFEILNNGSLATLFEQVDRIMEQVVS